MQRIELSDGRVYQVRPSFMMPYLIAPTEEVEKALFLCRWGVPFRAPTWKYLFPATTIFLCFLHAFLKIRDRCKRQKEVLCTISEKVWEIYHAKTVGQFFQRVRRLRDWATTNLTNPVKDKVLGLCDKAPEFKKTFSHPQAYRTSNALDRLMNYQDRILYNIRYFHGNRSSALLYLRSRALVWNSHPYSTRSRHEGLRTSPFEELNGFQYHSNWLQNMLVAASLGGWRT